MGGLGFCIQQWQLIHNNLLVVNVDVDIDVDVDVVVAMSILYPSSTLCTRHLHYVKTYGPCQLL